MCTNTGRLGSNERKRNLYIGRGRLAGREMIRGPEVMERVRGRESRKTQSRNCSESEKYRKIKLEISFKSCRDI